MIMQLGDIQIDRILEMEVPFLSPYDAFPDAPHEEIKNNSQWLQPWALCSLTGKLIITIQTWIIRTPKHLILVDTCIGCNKTNHYFSEWHQRTDDSWYMKLLSKGVNPEVVDYVFCTHLHGDHCGWNTRLVDGRWVPTFPNARYIISRKEVDYVAAENSLAYQESALPIIETGQIQAVESDFALNDSVWLEAMPGHTVGHTTVHLASGGQHAVLCGDLIHSPLQCRFPQWKYWIDFDPQQAIKTRQTFLESRAEDQLMVLTAHFPSPSAGIVEARGDAFNFRFTQS